MNDIKHGIRPIDANALLDAMPKSTVLLRHQVVDLQQPSYRCCAGRACILDKDVQ